ncbi:MAG: LysM peptidoglycan-binding domain-containing protein [Fluviicola sp.]
MSVQSKLVLVLILLFCSRAITAQSDFSKSDSIPDSIPKIKIIEVPPFTLLNTDTIQLGEHDELVCDSYTAMGQAWVYDALHSFNTRRMDKFGGHLNEKINFALAEIRMKGFNSDLKKLYIQIDPKTLTVFWVAVVGPSEDGRCYVSVDSRGSAGGGLPAVKKQCPKMHRIHEQQIPVKVLEFNENVIQCYDWDGNRLDTICKYVNIQQHFYKYYDPRIGNTITLAEYDKPEIQTNNANSIALTTTIPPKKKAVPVGTFKKYTVKSGDTLSQIAEKFHTTPAKIKQANGLRTDMIRAGQILKIPG